MAEIKSISGNHIYSAEFKDQTMKAYNDFYKNLNQNYIRDEWLDMLFLPNPTDIWKYDHDPGQPQHILEFCKQVHKVERTRDQSELEHKRLLFEMDKKITEKEYEYWKLYYLIREQERKVIWDKSKELKEELKLNKNLIKEYIEDDEIAKQKTDI